MTPERVSIGIEQKDYKKLNSINIAKGVSVSNLCRQIISNEINESMDRLEKLEPRLQEVENNQEYFNNDIRLDEMISSVSKIHDVIKK